jgi:hypothetical protein
MVRAWSTAREGSVLRAPGAWDRLGRNFPPQRWFHAVSQVLETVHARFVGDETFFFSFLLKICKDFIFLMCHLI